MANKKASLKSVRQTMRRTVRNRTAIGRLRTCQKKITALVKGVSGVEAVDEVTRKSAREYISLLDKAVKIGVIHRNKASRQKSMMAQFVF
ncbi:MAG: 30S ribosomal protein S20 [Puniceicoccales bacterium]|jgi:small subunit ribosomal protein S20|nr:30S ribosomal protein S20 [Puniceicoccales bacterium]